METGRTRGYIRLINILAIETTGPYASVAIINENMEIWEEQSDRKLSHLQSLIPMIEKLLKKCELQIDDITHIAVSQGPGSFTGIRIGMATAKALAQALDLPTIPVPTLKAFAWSLPGFDGLYCPFFDARRNQIYAGAYYRKDGLFQVAVEDGAYKLEEFLALLKAFDPDNKMKIMLFGDGIDAYGKAVEDWKIMIDRLSSKNDSLVVLAEKDIKYQRAYFVASFAYTLLEEGLVKHYEELKPVYLRKAEAQRRLDEKLARERVK